MRYLSISQYEIFIINSKKRSWTRMRLKDIREDLDITQKEVADYLHVKQNTYSQYENGQRQLPINLLILLAVYFHTSTDYILELTDERKPYPRQW
ncbi:MAG: helix-turn-helix transcriptional regulator [Ruminococcaceae bacterium]|nr:helix-turn-helix transcriptional regulator [Oscillospiraceae bacterium]